VLQRSGRTLTGGQRILLFRSEKMNSKTSFPQTVFSSPLRIITAICGLLLVISIFLPWMSPSAKLGVHVASVSGMNVNGAIGAAGIIGGILALAVTLLPSKAGRGSLFIIMGLAVIAVLAAMLITHKLPLLSSVVRSFVNIGPGVFIFGICGALIFLTGIIELPKKTVKGKNKLTAQPAAAANSQTVHPPVVAVDQFCSNCGASLETNAVFCANCGNPVPAFVTPILPKSPPVKTARHVSAAWWLLPLFLGVLGGLIAFLAVMKRNVRTGINLFLFGIIITAGEIILLVRFLSSYGIHIGLG
jgi:MFS family permease